MFTPAAAADGHRLKPAILPSAVPAALLASLLGCLPGTTDGADFVPRDDVVSDPQVDLLDPEFDAAEGLVVWQDQEGDMWLARIDQTTGDLLPADGRGKLLDTGLAPIGITGNGPEFGYGREGVFIGYTRLLGFTRWLATATRDGSGTWITGLLPDGADRYRPEGTPFENYLTGVGRLVYVRRDAELGTVSSWRDVAGVELEGTSSTGQGGRWLGRDFRFTAFQDIDGVSQLVEVDGVTGDTRQISRIPGTKGGAFNWYPPEYGGDLAIVGLIDFEALGVWRERAGKWELVSMFTLPSDKPFLSSPEAFVVNGRSYVAVVAASELAELFPGQPVGPSEVWVTGLDPADALFRRIDDPSTVEQRSEPEPFVLADHSVVYYTEKPAATGIRTLRRAVTGVEDQLAYGLRAYGGDWAGALRSERNCACTPFPVAEDYEEVFTVAPGGTTPYRHVTGADGTAWLPLRTAGGGSALVAVGGDGQERFRLTDAALGERIDDTSPLVDQDGNVYVAAQASLSKIDARGNVLWQTSIAGLARAPVFAPDGNLLLFTWNGWAYAIAPRTGEVLLEQKVTRRRLPTQFVCLAIDDPARCAYLTPPAVAAATDTVYVTQQLAGGDSLLQAWRYLGAEVTGGAPALQPLWASNAPVLGGTASAPVLSADGSRIYVQDGSGLLLAFAAASGEERWRFPLGFASSATPVVSDGGFIMPGGTNEDAEGYEAIAIVEDLGDSAAWRVTLEDFAPASSAASGRGDSFVLAARHRSSGALLLLTVTPDGEFVVHPWGTGAGPQAVPGSLNLLDRGGITVTVQAPQPLLKAFRATAPNP